MKLQQAFDSDRHTFSGAILSSYTFNSDYFEGTLLPMLGRKSVWGNTTVCLDAGAYQETTGMTESRPTKAGDAYYLAPMRVSSGRFHPKVYFFGADDRAVGFVGSANLSGAAFDQNKEIITHFGIENTDDQLTTPAAATLAGIRRFYSSLIEHPAAEAMGTTALSEVQQVLDATEWLADVPDRIDETVTTEVIHNLDEPLLDQFRSRIEAHDEELQRVDIVAPFYGETIAVPRQFTEKGIHTTVWLQNGHTQIDHDKLNQWQQNTPTAIPAVYESNRYVHGKLLIGKTEAAVYCLAGSPNASAAAMLDAPRTDTGSANVEVAILRRVPEVEHYEYLLSEFADQEVDYSVDEFTPQTSPSYQPPAHNTEPTVDLLSIEFTEDTVHAGGRLSGQVRLSTNIRDSDQFQLRIHPTTDEESITLPIRANSFSEVSDKSNTYTFTRRVTDQSQLKILTVPSAVTPLWNETEGMARWLSIQSQSVDREAEAAAQRDGVDTVWRTIQSAFLGGAEERAERIKFLNTLAEKLDRDEDPQPDDADGADGSGLRDSNPSSSYSGSTDTRNLSTQFENYYKTWTEHIRKIRNRLLSSDSDSEKLLRLAGERLAEINRNNTVFLLVRRELDHQDKEIDEFPDHLPMKYTENLYSRTEPGFTENTAQVAQLVNDVRPMLDNENRIHLQHYIGSNVIFGRLIAKKLLVDDNQMFAIHFNDDFEVLIQKCLVRNQATVHDDDIIDALTDSLWAQFDDLPDSLGDDSLSIQVPSAFLEKPSTRRFVMSSL